MTRKNKSARKSKAAAAAATTEAAPDESQASPAQEPAPTPLRLPPLVPEAAPELPTHPDSLTDSDSSRSITGLGISAAERAELVSRMTAGERALADVPAFLSTLALILHERPDLQPSEAAFEGVAEDIARSAWVFNRAEADEVTSAVTLLAVH